MHYPQYMNEHILHEKREREEKMLPQGGGSSGGRIGASIVAQSNECGVRRNPPLTSPLTLL